MRSALRSARGLVSGMGPCMIPIVPAGDGDVRLWKSGLRDDRCHDSRSNEPVGPLRSPGKQMISRRFAIAALLTLVVSTPAFAVDCINKFLTRSDGATKQVVT